MPNKRTRPFTSDTHAGGCSSSGQKKHILLNGSMKNILKRVSPCHRETTRYNRADRIRSSTSRSHDLSVTRQRGGSARSSPSTVIDVCGLFGIMAVATSSRLRSIIRFRVSGYSPFPMFSYFFFSIRLVAEIKIHIFVTHPNMASDSYSFYWH